MCNVNDILHHTSSAKYDRKQQNEEKKSNLQSIFHGSGSDNLQHCASYASPRGGTSITEYIMRQIAHIRKNQASNS